MGFRQSEINKKAIAKAILCLQEVLVHLENNQETLVKTIEDQCLPHVYHHMLPLIVSLVQWQFHLLQSQYVHNQANLNRCELRNDLRSLFGSLVVIFIVFET
jgi:hypothetical protein